MEALQHYVCYINETWWLAVDEVLKNNYCLQSVISVNTDIDDAGEDVGQNEEVALHVTNGRLGATLHTQPTNSSI